MPTTDIEFLRRLPFLQGAGTQALQSLANVAVERNYDPGQAIVEEGTTGRELYVIVQGLVEVARGRGTQEMVLAKRGPGDIFGEMGFLEARPRFATIRAVAPTRVLEFSEPELHTVLFQQPLLLYETLRMLMARLREADLKMITDLQSKTLELTRAYRELQEAQAALVEKEKLERELQLARDLQQSILPQEFPRVAGLSFAARSQPARQVGGDFYDVIPLREGRLGLLIADVSDKGMPAALYMALTRSLIHAEAKRSSSPRQVLLSVHRLLLEMTQADMFVTAFYAVLDPGTGALRYARAGHDSPLHVRPGTGTCQFLAAKGMLLGCLDDVHLEEAAIDLQPGDVLVLYTDGITDANSPSGEFFGTERLRQAVCAAITAGAQELCDSIFAHVGQFQADAVQYDDMALLTVKKDPA